MGEMEDLAKEWRRHVRLAILIALTAAPGNSLNESILHTHLKGPRLRFKATRDQVRQEMRWLGEQGLVTLEGAEEDFLVATLAETGLEVAEGQRRHHGVKSPALD